MNLLSFNKTNPNLAQIPFKENNTQAQKHKPVNKEKIKSKKKKKKKKKKKATLM